MKGHAMQFAFPVRLEPDEDQIMAIAPDVRGGATEADTEAEVMVEIVDCLIAALGGFIDLDQDLPVPSAPAADERLVALPPLVSAKLALYQAMREAGLGREALAARLGTDEAAVRRLLDLDRKTPIAQIDHALAALGKRLVVAVEDAA